MKAWLLLLLLLLQLSQQLVVMVHALQRRAAAVWNSVQGRWSHSKVSERCRVCGTYKM